MNAQTSQEFVELALEMLGEEGVPVTVTARNSGQMTASGDRATEATPRQGIGIIFPGSKQVRVGGNLVQSERVIMTPVVPEPASGDLIRINGRVLAVGDDGAQTYAPQGVPIMHDVAVES